MNNPVRFWASRFFSITLLSVAMLFAANSSQAQTTLLHYWSFNKVTARVNIPAPAIKADYSFIDTNRAVVQYDTIPGTPKAYVDSINTNSKSNGAIDNVAGDTVNARLGFVASNALRVRNPSWSSELRVYMPTTLYSNITIQYALQSSSAGSGQHTQVFAYSTDSGATWKTSGLTVNGANVDTLDCTQSKYVQTVGYGLVTISLAGDTTVNNNPRFVFRIRWSGQSSTFSGNNRIENLTVEGGPVPKTIVVAQPAAPDTLYSGQLDTILYSITGKISVRKSFFYSLDGGLSWNAIGSDTGFKIGNQIGYAWIVPLVFDPNANVAIAISDSQGINGYSSSFVVLPTRLISPNANLIHYWHFNQLVNAFEGPFGYSNIPPLPADYSAVDPGKAAITFSLEDGTPISYNGYVQGETGSQTNVKMDYPIGQSIEIGNPSDMSEMRFYIPTTNHESITVNYALQASGGTTGPIVQLFDYSVDSGLTWKTTALKHSFDTINRAPFINGGWGYISVDLSSDPLASDNPNLVFRLRFAGNNSGKGGYVRIDNVSVEGPVGQVPIAGAPTLVHYWNFNNLTVAYHVPNVPNLKADYSIIDTNAAFLEYFLDPGTSNSYLGYIDNVASADMANLRSGLAAGEALRVRNPVDSIQLRWHIPSTGYRNLVVKFVVESSSTGSGDSTQIYSYSVDGGSTWRATGMTVNGVNVDTLDVTDQAQYQGSSWGLVTVTFGSDTTVNNNPNLIFRIIARGNTHLTSGNNRYDDFTLDGVPDSAASAPPKIPGVIVTRLDGNASSTPIDTVYAGTTHVISYSVSGTVSEARTIEYSIDGGASWTVVAENISAFSYEWLVPPPQSGNARIRVFDANGVVGISQKFVIVDSGKVNNVWISSNELMPNDKANILWNTSGYLGETVNIDISFDAAHTWSSIVSNYAFGSTISYPWTAPASPDSNIIVRVTFASGAVGYSKPFSVLAPDAVTNIVQNSQVNLWPNPVQTHATIQYELPASENVSHSIRDLLGREVETILEGMQPAGSHEISIDGSREPVGMYRYELKAGDTRYEGAFTIVR